MYFAITKVYIRREKTHTPTPSTKIKRQSVHVTIRRDAICTRLFIGCLVMDTQFETPINAIHIQDKRANWSCLAYDATQERISFTL